MQLAYTTTKRSVETVKIKKFTYSLCKPNNNSEKNLDDSTEDSNFYQAILINHATNGTES